MGTLIIGLILGAVIYAIDNGLRDTMKKIHENDPNKKVILNIPMMSLFYWFCFQFEKKKEE